MTALTALRRKLLANGYATIPDEGKRPPLKEWQKKVDANADEIRLWEKLYPSASNTGILTATMPTLDIDITNPEAAEAVEALARERFEERGYVLVRVGQAPKRAIPFRTDTAFKKIAVNIIAPNGATEQKIELLATGQQVVADGIHPDTGKPYSWHGGSPCSIKHEDLPYISEAEARQLVDDAVALLVKDFDYTLPQAHPEKDAAKGNDRGAEDWAYLIENIRHGRGLHDTLRDLAGKLIASGMAEGAVVNFLRAEMEQSDAPHDDRWQSRYDDIPRLVTGAAQWKAAQPEAPSSSCSEDEARIAGLAKLNVFAYHKEREAAAKELGLPLKVVDVLVAKKRVELAAEAARPLFPYWAVEPWPEPVDGCILLQLIVEKIRQHVVMSEDQAVAVALWVALTWVHETAAVHSPILLVTSAEANSGKSTLVGLLGFLAHNALLSVSITGPALFRSIEKWHPTFAIDEADTAFINNDDLRAVVNSGWTRGQGVPRCDPETNEPRLYPTFCPKAVAMKGHRLPDTTLSRSIIIELKRKLPKEIADDFDHIDDVELSDLRRQLARWANDHVAALRKATPSIPFGFHNRVRANWKLMLAIAEAAGGGWAGRAWQAAGAIEQVKETFEPSIGVRLLQATRTMFESPDTECLLSREVIDKLIEDPEQPWVEYKRGKPITQKQLAALLAQYGIYPDTVHPRARAHGRGYRRQQFEEAWERYLGVGAGSQGFEACKCANADETGASDGFRSVRNESPHTSKNANLSNNHAGLHTCTDRKAGNGRAHEIDREITLPAPASPSGVEEDRTCAATEGTGTPAAPAEPAPVIDPWKDLDIPGFLDRRRPSQGEEAPASEAMPADRGQPTSELQAQADERRLEVIFEKILQQHAAEDSEHYLVNQGQCEVSNKP
jgi:putative DNA primase/helicase